MCMNKELKKPRMPTHTQSGQKIKNKKPFHKGNHFHVVSLLVKTDLLSRDQPSRVIILHLIQGTFRRVVNERVTHLQ